MKQHRFLKASSEAAAATTGSVVSCHAQMSPCRPARASSASLSCYIDTRSACLTFVNASDFCAHVFNLPQHAQHACSATFCAGWLGVPFSCDMSSQYAIQQAISMLAQCGEAFAAWLPGWGVPFSYAVAIAYVLTDTADKWARARKQAQEELTSSDLDPAVKVGRSVGFGIMVAGVSILHQTEVRWYLPSTRARPVALEIKAMQTDRSQSKLLSRIDAKLLQD